MSELREITYPCRIDQSRQKAMFQPASGSEPRPLLVGLHTWSFGCSTGWERYADACAQKNWHFIYPDFRGKNDRPVGCGSEYVVADIVDAVRHAQAELSVDPARIYLTGGSGGGHATLLLAARKPELWAAASAWCPISSLSAWHGHCDGEARFSAYARHIEQACGGDPRHSAAAFLEAQKRSPLPYLTAARLPLDISTGIHDGHTGSVPIGHAIRAYNQLAAPADRIGAEDIRLMEESETVPEHLAWRETDPAFVGYPVLLRRQSGQVRLTIFSGGHDILTGPAFTWLEKQRLGQAADWSVSASTVAVAGSQELSR